MTTTVTVTAATTAAANHTFHAFPIVLSTLASVGNISSAINSTATNASDTIDTDYIIDNNGALGSLLNWNNSSFLLADVNESFIDVGNSLIGDSGSGSAIASIWDNSNTTNSVNVTLLATAIIDATNNSSFDDETTWQLIEIVAKSVVLGFVILATVIGK